MFEHHEDVLTPPGGGTIAHSLIRPAHQAPYSIIVTLELSHQTVQEDTESNGYRGTGPGERVSSVNDQSSHHRVVSGQLHNAQTLANRSLTHVWATKYVSNFTPQTARKGSESNGYRGTGPGERVGSVNERLSHHQVVSGQLHDAQTSTPRPRASMEKLRKPFLTHLTHSVHRLPGSFIRDFFARAL